jgi:hypothetical protein
MINKMLKLMRLHEIHNLPVGSDEWKKAVYKYTLMSLSPEQELELKTYGKISVVKMVGQCIDCKKYQCTIILTTVGSPDMTMMTYEPID